MTDEERRLQETAQTAEDYGNLETALDIWRTLTALAPQRPDYPAKRGRVAQELGRWTEAESAFLESLRIKEDFWLAMLSLGSLFMERTDGERTANLQTAKSWLEKSIALKPNPASFSLLGAAHYHLAENEAAKSAFRKALEKDPSHTEAMYNLALLLDREGHNEEAEQLLRTQFASTRITSWRTAASACCSGNSEDTTKPSPSSNKPSN